MKSNESSINVIHPFQVSQVLAEQFLNLKHQEWIFMFLNRSLPAEMTTRLRVLNQSQYLFNEQKAEDFVKTKVLGNYCLQ